MLSFVFQVGNSGPSTKSTSDQITVSSGVKNRSAIHSLKWDTNAAVDVKVSGPCYYNGTEGGFISGTAAQVFPNDTCVFTASAPETATRAATTAKVALVAVSASSLTWTVDGPRSGCFQGNGLPTLSITTNPSSAPDALFSLRYKASQSVLQEAGTNIGRHWSFTLKPNAPVGQTVSFTISFASASDSIVDTTRSVDFSWKIGNCP